MIRKLLGFMVITLLAVVLMVTLLPERVQAQSIVVTNISNSAAFAGVTQRRSWEANGLFWVVYSRDNDGAWGNVYYKTSPTGETGTWSIKTLFFGDAGTNSSEYYSVWSDSTYMHYVRYNSIAAGFSYRMGTPNADGTIAWLKAEQTVVVPAPGLSTGLTICVDSNGYPWIIYTDGNADIHIYKSSTKDGTWTTDVGLGAPWIHAGTYEATIILPLTSGKMAYIASTAFVDDELWARRFDGTNWAGAPVQSASKQNFAVYDPYTAVAEGDVVHVAFQKDDQDIIYTTYNYSTNSWGAETTLIATTTNNAVPTMQINTDNGDRYVYWENYPLVNHVYYIKYDATTGSWDSYVDLVNEVVMDAPLPVPACLNCSYTCDGTAMAVYYQGAGPMLKFKSVLEAATVTTLAVSALQQTTATLNGEVTATGSGAIIERGFQYNTVASAVGAITISETGTWAMGAYSLIAYDLEPSTTYYYRAFAVNNWGTVYGAWTSFTTLALGAGTLTVETLDATSVTKTTAVLNGKITDVGTSAVTAVGFDWGPTISYGYSWSAAGTYTEFQYFAHTVSGLQPGLTYHFRARGVDGSGDAYGEDMMFMTGAPDSNGYVDITISETCGNEYAYIGILGNLSHTNLFSAGAINACANNTLMVVPGMATSYWTPDQALIGVLIDSLGTYETKVVRYYLGVEDEQEDFDLVLGMGNESRVTHGDLPALEGGARFGFEVAGYLDMTPNTANSYLVWKKDAFKLWIPSNGNITVQIGNDAAPATKASVSGISSGRHTVRVENTNVGVGWLRLYLDGTLMNTQNDAAMPVNGSPWYFFGNNSMPSMEYIVYDIAGVDTLQWQPECMITGNQTDDLILTYDGNITWGVNDPCISISIGPLTADPTYPDPSLGVPDGVRPYPEPSDWFSANDKFDECTGGGLPFYATFASASADMGMTTQSLYLFMAMGMATAVGLGVLVFTGSLMLAFIACGLVMGAGINSCIVGLWMLFTYGVMGISVLILQRTG